MKEQPQPRRERWLISGLKDGVPRLVANHRNPTGRAYMRAYRALESEFGPFTAFQRMEAQRVAAMWLELLATTRELTEARTKRRFGRGRRPNTSLVKSLARRHGLTDQSYAAAVKRLQELTAANRKPRNLADELRQRAVKPEGEA